jgi:putative endonuclease
MNQTYFTYMLKSQKDGSFYIGSTADLKKRIEYHNQGLSTYTSAKTPWAIVYFETFSSINEAMKREYFLKKQRNRAFYQRLIDGFNLKIEDF